MFRLNNPVNHISQTPSTNMLSTILAIFLGAIFWLHLRRMTAAKSPYNSHKLPPGPRGLPVIGHLHILGKLPNRSLHKLSQKYGPIMSLRLGSVPTIIVSSPAAAKLFLKTHDTVFASRPNCQAPEILSYGNKGMGFAKYGTYWRNVRKFCTLELLSVTKIDSMAGLRRAELEFAVESLKKDAVAREVLDVSHKVARLIEDMTCRMLFGKSRDERFQLTEIIHELGEIVGAFNVADYVPFLGAFDLQGLMRRFRAANKLVDKILETIIDDHEQDAKNDYKKPDRDFVDILLSLKNNHLSTTHEQLSNVVDRSHIKAIILDMIFAGIDTSQSTIEWIMSEVIRHPRVMKLVQEEIRKVMGDDEFVQESHLPKLSYLDMVVKESLRLHPVAPFLLPHESTEDIVIEGYYIPKKSRILVSAWAIGRDPEIWSENVEEFYPERFVDSNVDLRGKNFELIPFGSGRRGCPGMHLGLTTVKLVVAQLVHSFNWELPFGMSANELDMNETFGLASPRANHLLAIPCLRN